VVDDLGAVLTIAVFYTSDISFTFLFIALALWLVLFFLNIVGVRSIWVFIVIGIFGVWYPLLKSGVHATIAGVLVAFTIPLNQKINTEVFVKNIKLKLKQFSEDCCSDTQKILTYAQYDSIDDIRDYCNKVSSPLQNLEHALQKFTFYFVMPLFAFANTGIRFEDFDMKLLFSNNLTLGIFSGLVFGKVIGIVLFVFIFYKLKIIKIPPEIKFGHIVGAGFLAGIGFTMSIFITDLAFRNDELIAITKVSILFASLVAGLIGYLTLRSVKTENPDESG
jgi:NhaA family Na+:H+ antiporter